LIELIFLGTSASVPSVERGLPALLVRFGRNRLLVDCGEGTQRQLLRSGAKFHRLDRILLTHAHLDHVLGLGGLTATLALNPRPGGVTIHGGAATLGFVRRYLLDGVWGGAAPPLALKFALVTQGLVFADSGNRVDAFAVRHRDTDSYGFRFVTAPRRHLIPERLAALGIPAGPARRALARGRAVVLDDGRRIAADEVLGPEVPGTSLAVVGDTGETASLVDAVRGVDALVIEASFLERDRRLARERGHLTAADAGRLAAEAGVGALYLNHISERYPPDQLLDEARRQFPRAILAEDLMVVTVGRERMRAV
jgi:ribonuclease Z